MNHAKQGVDARRVAGRVLQDALAAAEGAPFARSSELLAVSSFLCRANQVGRSQHVTLGLCASWSCTEMFATGLQSSFRLSRREELSRARLLAKDAVLGPRLRKFARR